MPAHHETRFLPYTAAQMFDLVADIGRYPEFLPWVQAMRLGRREGNVQTADMIVGFKMVREKFTSRVTLDRPASIHVDYLDGPLKYLHNDWTFRDVDGGCEIDFAVDFEFRNKLFQSLAGLFFTEAVTRMVGAFERRAAVLYGSSSSSATSVA